MIWRTAWKNVWRNRVRSLVVIASVTTGVFAAVFSIAFMNGMLAQRFDAAIDEEISHIQITGEGFRLNNDPSILVPDPAGTESTVMSVSGVEGIVKRTVVTGMASTASKSAGVSIIGVDPEQEKRLFRLNETIMEGTGDYFTSESRLSPVLIGQDLAKELNIIRFTIDSIAFSHLTKLVPSAVLQKIVGIQDKRFTSEKQFNRSIRDALSKAEAKKYFYIIKNEAWSFREGSRLTLTFLDSLNNQVDSRFRVTGIYDTRNSMFEMSSVFIRDSDFRSLAGFSPDAFHVMIVRLKDINDTDRITAGLEQKLPGTEVMNWKDLQPDLAMMSDYMHQIYFILMAIIMAALAFGIVNTMLMAVLERTKELGMLAAIGMNRPRIFTMIMLESVFLSIVGGLTGMAVAALAIILTARNGINFMQYAEGIEAFGYSAHIFPEISSSFFIMMTVLVIITGILSAVYPAMKALKLNPVDAIRTE